MDEVNIVKFIKTTLLRKGKGVEGDPVRIIEQYWTFKGELAFEYDPYELTINSDILETNK